MAIYASLGGNASSSATWALCDATSESDSFVGSTSTTTSYQVSSTFTPGAITIDAILLRFQRTVTVSGTVTVALDQAGSDVAGTIVTVNVSDLPALSAVATMTWLCFKFAAPVTLSAATAYGVKIKSSVATTVGFFVTAGSNWSRELRTTTTAAPVAGDKLIGAGELTGAGTFNALTGTWDLTGSTTPASSVSFGSTAFLESIHIGYKYTLNVGTTAATAYGMKAKGLIYVGAGGTFNCGTSGSRMPASSSFTLTHDVTVNVDSGLKVDLLGTIGFYGASKQRWTFMTADKAAAATVIALNSTSGWQNGDVLCFASSGRSLPQSESKTVSTVDSSVQVTLTAGLTNAHTGTATGAYSTQCEVGNLTSNVKITGTSSSLQGYVVIGSTATGVMDGVETNNLGSATANKRGIDITTTTGTFTLSNCAVHDFVVSSSLGINVSGAASNNFTLQGNVIYNMANSAIAVNTTTGTNYLVDSNLCVTNTSNNLINLSDVGGVYTNNVATSAAASAGISILETNTIGTFSGNVSHSNAGQGYDIVSVQRGTIASPKVYFNVGSGFNIEVNHGTLTVTSPNFFGNGAQNITTSANLAQAGTCAPVIFQGGSLDSYSGFTTGNAVQIVSGSQLIFESVAFGANLAHTNTLSVTGTNAYTAAIFRNCTFAESTFLGSQSSLDQDAYILSQRHNGTAGSHKGFFLYGNSTVDTTIFNTASPSQRLTPNNASNKLASSPVRYGFRAAVSSGNTASVGVYVRKSVVGDGTAYNGNQPRLFVRRNVAAGISADTLLATAAASAGSWEQLTGATASVTDDAILEFYVDCDGTTGWINADDWSVAVAVDTRGLKYFNDGLPVAIGNNTSGGGQTSYTFIA